MAAAARSLRVGLCTCSRIAARLRNAPPTTTQRRLKSVSSVGRTTVKRNEVEIHPYEGFQMQRNAEVDAAYEEFVAGLSEQERAAQEEEASRLLDGLSQHPALQELKEVAERQMKRDTRIPRRIRESFWNEGEIDPDMITDGAGEDNFEENDITSMAHGKLQEHREHREYARLTVWEMPLLTRFAKPFAPPNQDEVLRFRYTTYMGEWHPAERKVVVEFSPRDLPLSEAEKLKLKKLVGVRYNPETDIVRMSCDIYENQAQNKRYLGDVVNKLITEAKDHTDMFEDIPLDTRHHTPKKRLRFPDEWKMTEKRQKELDGQRNQALLLDQAKRTDETLIDGIASIEQHASLLTAPALAAVTVQRDTSVRIPVVTMAPRTERR